MTRCSTSPRRPCRYQHIDTLFSDVIDRDLIEQTKHLKYMSLVANAVILHGRRAREPLVVVLNRAEFNGYCPRCVRWRTDGLEREEENSHKNIPCL